MLSAEENERFTRVGRGTSGGELLRRYWWPVGFADQVKGTKPVKTKLLGEEFVLFRDGRGRVGMLDVFCAHRTTLMNGRAEKDGLRWSRHRITCRVSWSGQHALTPSGTSSRPTRSTGAAWP